MGIITETGWQDAQAAAIAQKVNRLPTLPLVVHRLLEMVGREKHSLQEIVQIVESDSSLTVKVLRVANSAAFSRGQQITTVSRAIIHLGEKMVIGIALGACAPDLFAHPLVGYESCAGEMWDHSLCCAIATREVARYAAAPVSLDLAFTGGLLHDIGKTIISEFLRGNAETLTQWCDTRRSEDFLAAERELLGTDHCRIGAEMAAHWNLPQELCAVIRHHHHPSSAALKDRVLVAAVHTGDLLAMMAGQGTGADSLSYRLDETVESFFKIEKDDLSRIILNVQMEFSRTRDAVFQSS